MKCRWVRNRLQSYLDNTLNPSERQQVASHLESCPDCQKELNEWQTLFTALNSSSSWQTSPLPADFTARVMQNIRREPRRTAQPLWSQLLSQPVLASCAAALVFAIIFSPLLSDHLELIGVGALYHKFGTEVSLIQGTFAESLLNLTNNLQEFLWRLFLGGI